jgi:hypothetical protein
VLKEKDFALFCRVFVYYTTSLRVSVWSDSDTPSRTCIIGMKSIEQLIQLVPVLKNWLQPSSKGLHSTAVVYSDVNVQSCSDYLRGGWMCVWNWCYAVVRWCESYLFTYWMDVCTVFMLCCSSLIWQLCAFIFMSFKFVS